MENSIPLHEKEIVLLTIKRHWISLVFIVFLIIVLFLLSALLFIFQGKIIHIFSEQIFWCFLGLFWVFFSGIIFIIWIQIELDFLILTNKRFIYLEQKGFLQREKVEFDIHNIQEIRSKISGIFPTFFQYGEISISTAANTSKMTFSYAPQPNENIRRINNYLQSLKSEKHL